MIRFLLRHPPDPRPVLIIQASDQDTSTASLRDFRNFLFAQGCPNGLIFDSRNCHIFRESYTSLKAESIQEDAQVSTNEVLRKMNHPGTPKPVSVERRVERWVELLTTKWEDAIPDEPEISRHFFSDIIPAATQASVSIKRESAEDAA
jgi:hypothetical protein